MWRYVSVVTVVVDKSDDKRLVGEDSPPDVGANLRTFCARIPVMIVISIVMVMVMVIVMVKIVR
jgi:hypothetical protein